MKKIKKYLQLIKKKDPALHSNFEVLIYPFTIAYCYYKIAHFFYLHKFYFIARYLSEQAKSKTGIEIHPGASIGKNFFIDHGTGVVIGETAIIGNNVMLYHNVTLGALNFTKGKRHPTIEDNVTIGTGSIILGDITIGANSVIGAGAIVLKDVPKNSRIIGIYK